MESDTRSLLLFFLFILLGALVVLCQNAVIEVSDAKLRKRVEQDERARRLAWLLTGPSRFSASMRGAYTFFHLCAVGFLSRFAESLPLSPPAFWEGQAGRLTRSALVLLVGVFCILTLSRGIPRRIAASRPETLAFALAPLAIFFSVLFAPVAFLAEKTTTFLSPLFGVDPAAHRENVTEEEIRMMVDVSEETGGIEWAEKEMINAVFEFDDRTADQLMTHRTDVKFLELDASLEEVVAMCTEYGFSRIPVVGEDGLDDVAGILNVKDMLPLILADRRRKFAVGDYLRKPLFVPESTRCRDLFTLLNTHKVQVAIVVDEYGGTSGLVTMEDLVESIVGNIQDEYDNEVEEVTAIGQNRYTLDGDVDLPEVERTLGWDFSLCPNYEDYDTLGGLIIGLLDRIPDPGEHPSVNICGVVFTVQEANERQILRVLAEKPVGAGDNNGP